VKKFAFVCLTVVLVPLNTAADIIFFKDGMKTICHDRAWEEGKEIKCEYDGMILSYQKKDVLRIEKIKIEKETPSPPKKNQALSKKAPTPVKQPPEIKQTATQKKPAPETKQHTVVKNTDSLKTKGLKSYNPSRAHQYWTAANAKHNSFKEAVTALAKQYGRSPEWIQDHMGDTNELGEIHRNLANRKLDAPVKIQKDDSDNVPEILFYNPRRPRKYWTGANSKHNTFKEAIASLATQYSRSADWIQKNMGNSNNLIEIHQNLANSKSAESSQ
jgi:hypothetical protein